MAQIWSRNTLVCWQGDVRVDARTLRLGDGRRAAARYLHLVISLFNYYASLYSITNLPIQTAGPLSKEEGLAAAVEITILWDRHHFVRRALQADDPPVTLGTGLP